MCKSPRWGLDDKSTKAANITRGDKRDLLVGFQGDAEPVVAFLKVGLHPPGVLLGGHILIEEGRVEIDHLTEG